MTDKIYQLKVVLIGSKPPIWRRILTKADTLLPDLHKIIQTSMGWTNSHLHQFMHGRKFYSQPNEWDEMDIVDYGKIKIGQLLKKEKDKLVYEYDFGDSWAHELVLEKVLKKEDGRNYPECIDGKNACPPEDCGGVWGYANLLRIIADPKNEEHEEMMEWFGEDFDPKAFDKEEINEALGSEDYGVFSIW